MENCKICGLEFKVLTWKHIRKHGKTTKEYDELYGKTKHSVTNQSEETVRKSNETKKKKGIKPWNFGQTKETHASLKKISEDRMGENNPVHKIKNIEEWKANIVLGMEQHNKERKGKKLEEFYDSEIVLKWKISMSLAAKKRKIHGHTGFKHSEETKKILREKTSKRISENKNKVSKPQLLVFNGMKEKLPEENLILEYSIGYYSIDIAFPDQKLAIEVDGDFWHVNTSRGYAIKHESQKRNKRIEKSKTTYLENLGWKIIRIWESDINEDLENILNKTVSQYKETKNNAG
jgi:DNA mismatch endonuclease (patch repair protein)